MKSDRVFHLVFFSLVILLFIPNLLQSGMFVDGVLYSAISKNLSDGLGTFWSPHFSETVFPVFRDQPPLVFGMQSLFFRLLGDSMYVEKIYAFFIICITLVLIHILWRSIFKNNKEFKHLGFIPKIVVGPGDFLRAHF